MLQLAHGQPHAKMRIFGYAHGRQIWFWITTMVLGLFIPKPFRYRVRKFHTVLKPWHIVESLCVHIAEAKEPLQHQFISITLFQKCQKFTYNSNTKFAV